MTRTLQDPGDPFPPELGGGRYVRDEAWRPPPPMGSHLVARYKVVESVTSPIQYAAVKYYPPEEVERGHAERRVLRQLRHDRNPGIVAVRDAYPALVDGAEGLFLVTEWIDGGPLAARPDVALPLSFLRRAVPRWLENLQLMIASNIATNDQAAENTYPGRHDLLIGDLDHALDADSRDPPVTRPWYAPPGPPGSFTAGEKDVYGAGLVLFEMVTGQRILSLTDGDPKRPYVAHTVRANVDARLYEIADARYRRAILALLGAPGRGAERALDEAIDLLRGPEERERATWRSVALAAAALLVGAALAVTLSDTNEPTAEAPDAVPATTNAAPSTVSSARTEAIAAETDPTTATTPPPPTPEVTFDLATTAVNRGQSLRFTYDTRNITDEHRVVLQRRVGTDQVWAELKSLDPGATSGEFRPSRLGLARYRLAVVGEDGTGEIATSAAQEVRIYGPVPLSRITGGSSRTVSVGPRRFRYYAYETIDHRFEVEGSTCRYVDLRVAFLKGDVTDTPSADVTVISERAPAIHVTVPNDTVGVVRGSVGGDFEVYAANGEVGAFANDRIFINGKLYCSTRSGTKSG